MLLRLPPRLAGQLRITRLRCQRPPGAAGSAPGPEGDVTAAAVTTEIQPAQAGSVPQGRSFAGSPCVNAVQGALQPKQTRLIRRGAWHRTRPRAAHPFAVDPRSIGRTENSKKAKS